MSGYFDINLASVNIVKNELLSELQQAGNYLEQFISSRDQHTHLEKVQSHLAATRGILQILEMQGAIQLAEEMQKVVATIPENASDQYDPALSALSTSLFVLGSYIEYCQRFHRAFPVLLTPYINDLRLISGTPLMLESHYFEVDFTADKQGYPVAAPLDDAAFVESMRRFRHMYQVGMLGMLSGKSSGHSLGMMRRAAERIAGIAGSQQSRRLWWLIQVFMSAAQEQKMELSRSRKFLLSGIDRHLRNILQAGVTGLDKPVPEQLIRELVYLITISGAGLASVTQVCDAFGVSLPPYSEKTLQAEISNLRGPGMSTIHSVAEVISEELRSAKSILESLSVGAEVASGYDEISTTLTRVADIMAVIGLTSPSATLKEQAAKLHEWQSSGQTASNDDLVGVADALLFVESTVSALQNMKISPDKLAEATSLAKDEIMASSQLAEAEKVVIEEVQAGLALIKRALSSFVESNYDQNHVANVGTTLTSVRGGMIVLNMSRAARIVDRCVVFIDESLFKGGVQGAIQQALENFADAIISLEYYLESYAELSKADESILDIAEESLQALGYPV